MKNESCITSDIKMNSRGRKRQVFGNLTCYPSEITTITRKCYEMTDHNDRRNKENTFYVIPYHDSHSMSPQRERQSRQKEKDSDRGSKISTDECNRKSSNIAENKKIGDEIDIVSAVETFVTPASRWNTSIICDTDSSTPNYQCNSQGNTEVMFFKGEQNKSDTNQNRYDSEYAGDEEEELVSIHQSFMNKRNKRQTERSSPLLSGRENPAIPTEKTFQDDSLL